MHKETVQGADEIQTPVIEVVDHPVPVATVDSLTISLLEYHGHPLEDEEHEQLHLRVALEHEENEAAAAALEQVENQVVARHLKLVPIAFIDEAESILEALAQNSLAHHVEGNRHGKQYT